MRAYTFSLLLALAVFITASGALAQGLGHCLSRPLAPISGSLQSRELTARGKTPAKDPTWMASRVFAEARVAAEPAAPGQSRAPTVCVDPSQPGCHVDVPDAPSRHGSFFDAMSGHLLAAHLFEGLPPPPDGVEHAGGAYDGGPREGFARPQWRPPGR